MKWLNANQLSMCKNMDSYAGIVHTVKMRGFHPREMGALPITGSRCGLKVG